MRSNGQVDVQVSDNGVGGADPAQGSDSSASPIGSRPSTAALS